MNDARTIRYAYVKNGDVVAQIQRVRGSGKGRTTSGPDAFLNDFLNIVGDNPLLLLGQGRCKDIHRSGNVTARVLPDHTFLLWKIFARVNGFLQVLLYLLIYRPQRIVCGRSGSMLWACFIASRLYSVPLVHSRHNQVLFASQKWFRRLGGLIDYWCIKRATAVVCHGPFLKEQLLSIGVFSNRLFEFDVGFRDTQRVQKSLPHSVRNIDMTKINSVLFVGRVQANKGVFDLLDAMEEELAKDNSVMLIYAGEGLNAMDLTHEVEMRGLIGKVLTLGEVPHSEILALIESSAVVITPTRSSFPEGRCMAAMEAFVMGVPVIAPNFGPFPFLVNHGENGLLFEPDSVADLTDKLKSLLNDRKLRGHLRQGARKAGQSLLRPIRTFGQAIEKAFSPQVISGGKVVAEEIKGNES